VVLVDVAPLLTVASADGFTNNNTGADSVLFQIGDRVLAVAEGSPIFYGRTIDERYATGSAFSNTMLNSVQIRFDDGGLATVRRMNLVHVEAPLLGRNRTLSKIESMTLCTSCGGSHIFWRTRKSNYHSSRVLYPMSVAKSCRTSSVKN
jgi:hypothetical protein